MQVNRSANSNESARQANFDTLPQSPSPYLDNTVESTFGTEFNDLPEVSRRDQFVPLLPTHIQSISGVIGLPHVQSETLSSFVSRRTFVAEQMSLQMPAAARNIVMPSNDRHNSFDDAF